MNIELNSCPHVLSLFRIYARPKIPPRASRFVGVKMTKNKKGSRDKISQPLELYGRDGVIRTLDP